MGDRHLDLRAPREDRGLKAAGRTKDCSAESGFSTCTADGFCFPTAGEPSPEKECIETSQCVCYPGYLGGTCAIACRTDRDCPVQPDTGLQMICPGPSDAVIPTYSFCAVPCGITDACATLGLVCGTDPIAGASAVCTTPS